MAHTQICPICKQHIHIENDDEEIEFCMENRHSFRKKNPVVYIHRP